MNFVAEQDIAALCNWLAEKDDFVFFDTARVTEEESRSLLFTDPLRWLICDDSARAEDFLQEVDALQQQGAHLAGWFAYEFGYLLEPSLRHLIRPQATPYAVIGVFGPPLVIDHSQEGSSVLRDLDIEGGSLIGASSAVHDIRTSQDEETYLSAIDRIKEYIVAGDTYQVNYTLKLNFSFSGSVGSLYRALRRNQAVSFGAWMRQGGRDILSLSPELFFRSGPDGIVVRPMKGTMSRGRTLAGDLARREELHTDLKNLSENVMIVDLLRNDLGRLLHNMGGGRVQPRSLFDVEVYDTLLQMTSTVEGIPSAGRSPGLRNILKALFPCGSVTGAPKIRTMEIIHELEKEPRGVYCGAIGYAIPGSSVFNVPIRTVVLEGGEGEMGIGSGIVHDSDPASEWQESLLKGRFLTDPRPAFQLIETLLWQPGTGYWLLEEHMQRLADSAAYFLFDCSQQDILAALQKKAARFIKVMRVRLLLYKGGQYSISATDHDAALPVPPESPIEDAPLPAVLFSAKQTDPENIHLYHKTTERSLYVAERERVLAEGFHEVLFTNVHGEMTEGSISNIFIREKGQLVTPPVSCGLLAGTFRRYLLDRDLAVEKVLSRDSVLGAEAVYVGNSVRGLVRVAVQAV